ncbi:TPA: hypothetical protein QHR60_004025 [Escherichia coli]|nr:hypothetical protein [Escherichia coli]
MRNGFVSDEQYQHSLAVFKELLDADVYESGNKKIIDKFESALDICLAYERQCFSQDLHKSLISSYSVLQPKRAAYPIISIY